MILYCSTVTTDLLWTKIHIQCQGSHVLYVNVHFNQSINQSINRFDMLTSTHTYKQTNEKQRYRAKSQSIPIVYNEIRCTNY